MQGLSLPAKLTIAGWSLLAVSLSFHVRVATLLRDDDRDGRGVARSGRSGAFPRGDAPPPPPPPPRPPDAMRTHDAVIVGAGWAGLRAARALSESGVSDVLVLEANGHVGGRSKSINEDGTINSPATSSDNVPVEAGSEWLYDSTSMGKYLKESEIAHAAPIIDPRGYSGLLKGAKFYRQARRKDGALEAKEVTNSDELKDEVWEGIRSFRKKRLKKLKKGDESWGDAFDAYKRRRNMSGKEIEYIDLLGEVAKIEYTCESDQMSLREIDLLDQDIPTTRYMGVRGLGFGNVAARFGEPLSSKIRLNSRVTEINNYPGGGHAFVKFLGDDGRIEEVAARTVLVTASLGVLKAGNIKFTPKLPRYKREAIDGMGFGVVNKCAMYWNDASDAVWPNDAYWFKLMGSEEAGRWTYFFNPSSYKGVPTLTAWIGGDDALEMERRTNEEVVDEFVMRNLRAMFPGARRPDRVVVTRWGREANVLGTYSYKAARRNFTADAEDLRRRVGRLWFAGEATSPAWLGTTIGAWQTGKGAAEGMARALKAPARGESRKRGH